MGCPALMAALVPHQSGDCPGHYAGHLSTMAAPSPCRSGKPSCLGDPAVARARSRGAFRCPVRSRDPLTGAAPCALAVIHKAALHTAHGNGVSSAFAIAYLLTAENWDSDNPVFTMRTLSAGQPSGCGARFRSLHRHAMVPFPFRDFSRLVTGTGTGKSVRQKLCQ